jgi:hypothetical protein
MELDSIEAIKSPVEADSGIGFVSRGATAKASRLDLSFKIVEVEGLSLLRDFLVVQAADPEPPGLAIEFRRFLFSSMNRQRALAIHLHR